MIRVLNRHIYMGMFAGVAATGYKLYRVDKNAESANVEWYYNSILVERCFVTTTDGKYDKTANGERYVRTAKTWAKVV